MKHVLPKTLFSFIWHFLKPYKLIVLLFVMLAIMAGFFGPFNSLLIKHIINTLPSSNTTSLMLMAGLMVMNFLIFDNVTWRGLAFIRSRFTPHLMNRITTVLMHYVLAASHQFYQDHLSGQITKNIGHVVDGIEKLTTSIASNFLRGASLLIIGIMVAYHVHPVFSGILIIWFTWFATCSVWMSKKLVILSNTHASAESTMVGKLVDVISNHSNVRLFARKHAEPIYMQSYLTYYQVTYQKVHDYTLMINIIQGAFIAIMMAFSVFSLVYLHQKGLVTAGDVALILGLSMETGHMMWFTLEQVDDYNKEAGRCKQSLKALLMPLDIHDKPNATLLNCTHGNIVFCDVTFAYKNIPPLFYKQSINLPAGQKVGLVGYSGGGKSTFVNLILRLYDVTEGAILIDGQNIQEVTQDSLRTHIAMIPQDPSLFHRSLMENIRYGRMDATDTEVIEAAKQAHAHEFITMLPQGYDALVGERGVKLSGGQRQRVAIARAFLKNAPILILDEATSQLDSVTENHIQAVLKILIQGKTTLVIAHRLSTLLHMDRILVFDQGNIVEDGTHLELLSYNGLYKSLWDA
jgi:ATP-binding cassette, subfamily B, bacterial